MERCLVCEDSDVLTNENTGEKLEYCSKKCRKVAVKVGLLEACENCGLFPKLLEYGKLLYYCETCELELTTIKKYNKQERRQNNDSGYGECDDEEDFKTYYHNDFENSSKNYDNGYGYEEDFKTYYHNDFENDVYSSSSRYENHFTSSSQYENHFTSSSQYENHVTSSSQYNTSSSPQIIFVQTPPPPPPQIIVVHPPPIVINNQTEKPKKPSNLNKALKVGAKIGINAALNIATGGLSGIITSALNS